MYSFRMAKTACHAQNKRLMFECLCPRIHLPKKEVLAAADKN